MNPATPDSQSPHKPRRLIHKLRRGIVIYALVPYLAVTVIFAVIQRKLIYQPTVAESLSVADAGLDAEAARDVELQTPDGATLHGWLILARKLDEEPPERTPLVVYFPGNSINRYERLADLKEVAACGFDVLIFDYRGYGDSSGSPSERALTADAGQVWQYATEEFGYDEQHIVIFGESIGGAVALSLWSEANTEPPEPAALILSSPFASLPETVGWHYPWFPFRFLLLDRWPSIERIPRVDVPIVIFHGTADEIVPVAQAKQLATEAPGSRFIEISGAGHNDIPMLQLRQELQLIATRLKNRSRAEERKPK